MAWIPPAAGELRHRLAMETLSQSASGGASGTGLADSYAVAATLWGRVLGLAGGRWVAGRQTQEIATHRVVVRHAAGYAAWTHVSEALPAGGGTRRWAIRGVQDPEGRGRWLELDVEEEKPS